MTGKVLSGSKDVGKDAVDGCNSNANARLSSFVVICKGGCQTKEVAEDLPCEGRSKMKTGTIVVVPSST
jgi:hypothetical protein